MLSPKHYLRSKDHFKPAQLQRTILHWHSRKTFPKQFNNQTKSFNIKQHQNDTDTELSKEYWTMKHDNFTPKVTCRIITKYTTFNTTKIKFHLYLDEKLEITSYKGDNLMNKGSGHVNKCGHQI